MTRFLRGSSLLLVIVLLLVLSVIGVAAVSIASQERTNASAKGQYDRLVACASAAQGKLWAEMAHYGPNYLSLPTPVASVTLPDGSQVTAPGHYGVTGGTLPQVKDVTLLFPGAASGTPSIGDLTNQVRNKGNVPGVPWRLVANCKDAQGREYEVEFALRFGL